MKHVLLIGFMGAGKTTVARLLGERLSMPVIDLDARIEERCGSSITELFEREGEARFREIESAELSALAEEPPSIVACGGGIVLLESNRRELSRLGTTVYLRVSAEDACSRLGGDTTRPLLAGDKPRERIEALLAFREPVYVGAADIVVDASQAPETIAEKIVEELARCGR